MQEFPAGNGVTQVVETMAKSLAFVPLRTAGEKVRLAVPVFDSVSVRVCDVLTAMLPKFRGEGEKLTTGLPAETRI
jgi:hypothetical protein